MNLLDSFFIDHSNRHTFALSSATSLPVPTAAKLHQPDLVMRTEGVLSNSPSSDIEWIQEEKRRFEAFVSKQFNILSGKRAEISAWHSNLESDLVTREQVLNRQRTQMKTANEALELRQREMTARELNLETAVTAKYHRWLATAEAEVKAQRNELDRRAEALKSAEQALEQRSKEIDRLESDIFVELRNEAQRLQLVS